MRIRKNSVTISVSLTQDYVGTKRFLNVNSHGGFFFFLIHIFVFKIIKLKPFILILD